MKRISISSLCFLVIAVCAITAAAQEPAQKPASDEGERPKTEVERALEDAKSRGEIVMGTCVENCGDFDRDSDKEFERGRVIRMPKPAYPAIARAAHASGEVRVQVVIGFEGEVIAASVLSGHPLLQAAAAKAARESLFTPTKYEGKPVKVVGVMLYNFVAQ